MRISSAVLDRAVDAARPLHLGTVTELVGLHLEVRGLPEAAAGDLLEVRTTAGPLLAEVAALRDGAAICLPLGTTTGVRVGDHVHTTGGPLQVRVGDALRGRVLDGLGRPVDGGPPLDGLEAVSTELSAPDALSRPRITEPLGLGVRALDALVPAGRGQRLGIMAGSGVGKSSLLSMIARGTDAEVNVIALVGERGREVREFIDGDLGPEGLARSVVVVATSDAPAVERLRAAFTATRIAEWFRDSGRDVLLMMDSLTRVAMAQREIGLSAGEPPATRGYPPSVFGLLPRLLERAGTSAHGSITGLYTVLVEGDDLQDPIGDTARSILDGHVVLSRELATAGHFPAIDVLESISRVHRAVTTLDQQGDAARLRRMLAAHRSVRELVEIGAYVAGADEHADAALARLPRIEAFLQQDMDELTPTTDTWDRLAGLVAS
ncbi:MULTISPECIES: FliI/YscN family ATPase [unclassified Nocardioides]|jgi:flagellum-specific ATP synthase|uniref:FliI/YscN family ATPase n=1 Tax=unclassified Nocardioides TaxID=2615069 RepID=UPI0007024230|nr:MULTISPECIES: FliI/YscN family ATPase [unclassified Nocardioides]KRC52618.1 flagellar protein export ATPase FliI [Nocardioides sp. Root79]KRC72150.1 flagellar protein export ATPase FliI [Nocardioides sp. Root240]